MGQIVAVLGTGPSIKLFNKIAHVFDTIIGVNDIWKFYKTDAIVCLDKPRRFTPDRLKIINESKPDAFYSQIVVWDERPDFKKIHIRPGYPDGICILDGTNYQKSYCSPYVAVQVALYEYAATEIHLFGVDLVDHPKLDKALCADIKIHFSHLKKALSAKGCQLIVYGSGMLTA